MAITASWMHVCLSRNECIFLGLRQFKARVWGSQVLVGTNTDGTAEVALTGLMAACQLATTDFLFF